MNRPIVQGPPPGTPHGPGSGVLAGGVHEMPVRVYFEDTDAAGIVYYANYLKFAERGRTEMLRLAGTAHSRMIADKGLAFVVRRCAIDFMKPARLDDMLRVRTKIVQVGGASARAEQWIVRDGDELVAIQLKLACTNKAGRPSRLPKAMRATLEKLINDSQRG